MESDLESEFKSESYTGYSTYINLYTNGLNTASPLDQFAITDYAIVNTPLIANLGIYLTNIVFYLMISIFITYCINLLNINYNKLISVKNNLLVIQESVHATIKNIIINQISSNNGQYYFALIFTIMVFILLNNLTGMIPYGYASTSHFILTFFISFTLVIGATILGSNKHGLNFFSFFVPSGCPLNLLPLLVLIEFISYIARNVSLGLRLAANVLSGHMLLNILSGFSYNIMSNGFIQLLIGLIPLAFILAFSGLELGISFIQAQVFVVLTCSYIKDALDLH